MSGKFRVILIQNQEAVMVPEKVLSGQELEGSSKDGSSGSGGAGQVDQADHEHCVETGLCK